MGLAAKWFLVSDDCIQTVVCTIISMAKYSGSSDKYMYSIANYSRSKDCIQLSFSFKDWTAES